MASPAHLMQTNPGTLPADFNEWDAQPVPVVLPEDFNEFDGSTAVSTENEGKPLNTSSESQKVADHNFPAQLVEAPDTTCDDAGIEPTDGEMSQGRPESVDILPKDRSWVTILAIISSAILLLLLLVSLLYVRRSFAALKLHDRNDGQTYKPAPSHAPTSDSFVAISRPSPSIPLVVTTKNHEVSSADQSSSHSSVFRAMDARFNIPARIPKAPRSLSLHKAPKQNTAGMERIGGVDVVGGVFATNRRSVVKAESRPVVLSAGVMEGRLIHKKQPRLSTIGKKCAVVWDRNLECRDLESKRF